jgi:hypothetical protein
LPAIKLTGVDIRTAGESSRVDNKPAIDFLNPTPQEITIIVVDFAAARWHELNPSRRQCSCEALTEIPGRSD